MKKTTTKNYLISFKMFCMVSQEEPLHKLWYRKISYKFIKLFRESTI